jgi:LPXTG-motif cell wall-anchored protein
MGTLSQTLRVGLALFLAMFGTSALPTASAYAMGEATADEAVQTQLTDLAVTAAQEAAPPAEVLPPATESSPVPPVDTSTPPSDGVTDVTEPVVQETQEVNPLPTALFSAPETRQGEDKNNKSDKKDECDNDRFSVSNRGDRNNDCYDECNDDRFSRGDRNDNCDVECDNDRFSVSNRGDRNNDCYDECNDDQGNVYDRGARGGHKDNCHEVISLPTPTVDDPCGPRNAKWTMPADTEQYTWHINKDNELIVTANPPYVFSMKEKSHNYGTAEDENKPCEVACSVNSMVYVTMWITDGEEMPAVGPYPEEGVPATYKFTVDGLELTTPEVESYVYGLIHGGYTKLVDVDAMSYKTFRFADSTGNSQVVTAYILNVDLDGDTTTTADQTYFFYEPIYNGAVQDDVWQTWDVYNAGNAVIWGNGNGDPVQSWNSVLASYPNALVLNYGFNQGTYNQGTHALIQDVVFDCATVRFSVATTPSSGSGQVLSDTITKPVATATPQVPPATIPATGGTSDSNFGIVLGIVLSALTYFAMMRRQQEA